MSLKTWRLNLGCGCLFHPGCVNVDIKWPMDLVADNTHPCAGVSDVSTDFVQADALVTPFRDESFHYIQCHQLVEHIELAQLPWFLEEVDRLLAPGGQFITVFPDIVAVAQIAERGEAKGIAEQWGAETETPDLWTLQLVPYSVGHQCVMTAQLYADQVSKRFRVWSATTSYTNAVVTACKNWG